MRNNTKLKKMPDEVKYPFKKNDEVVCSFQGCSGSKFTVARVHTCNNCMSGFLVVAYLKGAPDREIKGTIIDGVNYGIDAGWFTVIL